LFYQEIVGEITQNHGILRVKMDGAKPIQGYSGGRVDAAELDKRKLL